MYLSSDLIFHTLEGEGISIGKPAVFLRMSSCNLTCKGWATPDNPNGCDSASAWQIKNKFSVEELIALFEKNKYHEFLQRGDILKITGGEPMLQQKELLLFVEASWKKWGCYPIEIETNATLMPDYHWQKYKAVFVCSPKLANNGDAEEKRYKRDVLNWHSVGATVGKSSIFKFVVCTPEDLQEIMAKYVEEFLIPRASIWLMPEGASREAIYAKSAWVAELCKEHGFNFSTRLQIIIWDRALGV